MAAPASRILQELERDLDKAIHAFGYAPGMDAPWLPTGRWGDAYGAMKVARRQVHVMLAAAVRRWALRSWCGATYRRRIATSTISE
mgnify:CR=1 FL=1